MASLEDDRQISSDTEDDLEDLDEMERAYEEGLRLGKPVLNWGLFRTQFDEHLENEEYEEARVMCKQRLQESYMNADFNRKQKARVLDAYAFLCDEHLRKPLKAKTLLGEALVLDPKLDSAHYHMGSVCSREEIAEPELAEQHYKIALLHSPESAEYHVAYAMLLEEFGEEREAEVRDEYTKALEIEPNHDGAHDGLGRLYMNSQQFQNYDLSGHHFRKAIELNSNDECSRYNYGLLLKECGNYQEAAYQLYLSLKIDPDDIETRLDYAKVLIGCKRYDDAVDEFLHLIASPNFEGDDKGELHDAVRGLLDNQYASQSEYYAKYAKLLYEQNHKNGALTHGSDKHKQVMKYATFAKKFDPSDEIVKGLEVYIGKVVTPRQRGSLSREEIALGSGATTPTTTKSDASSIFFPEGKQAMVDDIMERGRVSGVSSRTSNASTRRRPVDDNDYNRLQPDDVTGYLSTDDDRASDFPFEKWLYDIYDMYIDSERYEELERTLHASLQKQKKPENLATIHLFLATVQNDHLQKFSEAQTNFNNVLHYEPENKEALYALAVLARDNLEDYSRAAFYFTKLIGLNEFDVNAHLLLSELMLQNLANESGALNHVFKARRIITSPDSLASYISSCKLTSESEIRQKKIEIYNYCGRLLAKLSHPSEAMEMYWRALDIDHANSETHILLRNIIHSEQCKDVRIIRLYANFLRDHGRREEDLKDAEQYFELADEYERNPPRMSVTEDSRPGSSRHLRGNSGNGSSSDEHSVDEVFSRKNVVTSDDIRDREREREKRRSKNSSRNSNMAAQSPVVDDYDDFDDVVERGDSLLATRVRSIDRTTHNKSRPEVSVDGTPIVELEQKVRSLEQFRQRSSSLLTEKDTQLEALHREINQMSQDYNTQLQAMKTENEKLQRRLRAKDEEVMTLLNERRQLVDENSKILEEEKTHRKRVSELEVKSEELQGELSVKLHELTDLHDLEEHAKELTEQMDNMKNGYEEQMISLREELLRKNDEVVNLVREKTVLEEVNTQLTDYLTTAQQDSTTQQKTNDMLLLYCEELEQSKMRLVHETSAAMQAMRDELHTHRNLTRGGR